MTLDTLIDTLQNLKALGLTGQSELDRVIIHSPELDIRAISSTTPQILQVHPSVSAQVQGTKDL